MDLSNTEENAKPRLSRLSVDYLRVGERRESLMQGVDWDPSNMSYNTLMFDDNFGKIKDYYNDCNESINFLNSEQNIGAMNNSIMGILAPNPMPAYQLDEIHEDVQVENDPMLNDSQKLQSTAKQNKESFLAELHVNGFDTMSVFNGLSEGDRSQHIDITHLHVAHEILDHIIDRAIEIAFLCREYPSEYSHNQSNLKLAKLIETQLVIVSPRESEALKEIEEESESHQLSLGSATLQKNKNPFSSDYSVSNARSNGLSYIPQGDNQSDHFYYLSNATFNVQQNSDAGLMISTTGKLNPDSIFRINDRLDNSFIPDPNSKVHFFQRGLNLTAKNSNANALNHSHDSEAKLNNFEPLILASNQNYTFHLNTDALSHRPNITQPVAISHWNKAPLQRKKTKELEEIKSHSDEDLADETMLQLSESGLHNEKITDSRKILQVDPDLPNFRSNDKFKEDLKSNRKIPIRSRKENESISFANARMNVDADSKEVYESLPNEEEHDSFIEEIDRQIRISNIKMLQRTTRIIDDQAKEKLGIDEPDIYFEELLKPKKMNGNLDSHRLSFDFRDSRSFDNKYEGIMMKFGFKAANEEILARQMLAFSSNKNINGNKELIDENQPPKIDILTEQISSRQLNQADQNTNGYSVQAETNDSEATDQHLKGEKALPELLPTSIKTLSNDPCFDTKIDATEASEFSAKKLSNTTAEVVGSDISQSKRKVSIPTNSLSKLNNLVQQLDSNTELTDQPKPEVQKAVVRLFKRNKPALPNTRFSDKVETINSVLQNSILPNTQASNTPSINPNQTPKKSMSQQSICRQKPMTPEPKKSISNVRRSSLNLLGDTKTNQEFKPHIRLFKKVPSGFLDRNKEPAVIEKKNVIASTISNILIVKPPNESGIASISDSRSQQIQNHALTDQQLSRISNLNTKTNFNGSSQFIVSQPAQAQNTQPQNANHYPRPPNGSFPTPTANPNAKRLNAYASNLSGQALYPNSKEGQQFSYKNLPNSYWVNYNSSETSLRDSQHSSKQTSFYKDMPTNVNNSTPTKPVVFTKQSNIINFENLILNSSVPKQGENNPHAQNCNLSSGRLSRSPVPQSNKPKLTRNFSIDLARYPTPGLASIEKLGLHHVAYQSNNPCIQASSQALTNDATNGLKTLPVNVTPGLYIQPVHSQPQSNKKLEAHRSDMIKPNVGVIHQFESNKLKPEARVMVQGREAVLVRVDKDGKEYYRFADALK